jgi:hypothetical protein
VDLVALALAASAFQKQDNRPVPLDEDLARRIIGADDAVDADANSVEKLVEAVPPPGSGALAKGTGWYRDLRDTLSEAVFRVGDAPGFVLTRSLEELRVPLNECVTQFIGDVFVYLDRRGGNLQTSPQLAEIGTIPTDFLNVLVKAQQEHPDEKTVVLTHSMGGQIVYDAVTRFLPDYPEFANARPIDLWCACASQVGLFEEMKLFIRSDRTIGDGAQVQHPRAYGRVRRWLNIWDRNDILSYTASPIFADLENDDREFIGGASVLNAHGAYLVRPSFYRMLAEAV